MKQLVIFSLLAVTLISIMNACGPSEEEIQRRKQARQDSIEQARQMRLEQMRQDSIAQARADSIAAVQARKKQEEEAKVEFSDNGSYAVQVEAWRSEEKAQARIDLWKKRGYENAYVVKFGKEETGNVWYRIRLGRVDSQEMADKLGNQLKKKYDTKLWISRVS